MMLHRRYSAGETVSQLAVLFDIPEDRVAQRIRAAALYAQRQNALENITTLGDQPGCAGRH
jgi:hypothetical protein